MPNVIAIDQSTSATKALVFSDSGELLAKASRSHQQIYPQPGWVEHDGVEIWKNTVAVVRELKEFHPDQVAAAERVSVSNQRETTIVFDRRTGQPLHNAIVWQCRRGADTCKRLAEAGHERRIASQTGLKLDPYFSASKLNWLIENRPEVAAALQDGTAVAGTIDAYLICRMTRGEVVASDATNACRTLLFDIHRCDWREDLFELFSVPVGSLPEVRDSNASFGVTDFDGVLPRPLPIRGVMGDSQASLFAMGCRRPGQAKATLGTGCSLLLNLGESADEASDGVVKTIAWLLNGRPTYCAEGIINFAAATIEWLKEQAGLIEDARETESLARSVPDNGGVYFVPAFAGLGAPHWRPEARAAIVGLTSHSTRAHIGRAALESIAYQARDAFAMLTDETGVAPTQLRVDGGATSNRFLMQFLADQVGVECLTTGVAESSPLGAALCGAVPCDDPCDHSEPTAGEAFTPTPDREAADAAYVGWNAAIQRVL